MHIYLYKSGCITQAKGNLLLSNKFNCHSHYFLNHCYLFIDFLFLFDYVSFFNSTIDQAILVKLQWIMMTVDLYYLNQIYAFYF